jgi:hypothetical protein
LHWFLLLLHTLAAFLFSFLFSFLAFGNLFLRQELQDHTSFTLKVQQPPLGAMEEFTSGSPCIGLLLIKMIWWFLGSQKSKMWGIYWVATHHKSELEWVPGNSLCSFEVQILSVRLMYSCN